MTARTFDISDFSQTEATAFKVYVSQFLGFVNATEEQAARTVVLPAIYSAVTRAIRDGRQCVGGTR